MLKIKKKGGEKSQKEKLNQKGKKVNFLHLILVQLFLNTIITEP